MLWDEIRVGDGSLHFRANCWRQVKRRGSHSTEMKETRVCAGFGGVGRSQQAGSSLEMKPEVRGACGAVMLLLFLALLVTAIAFAVEAFQPHPHLCFPCPFDWIGYRGRCYYFSEAEGNWTSSQDNCSALGASLATLDTGEDLSFVMRYKGVSDHWIGLSREDEEQPWKWVNDSHLSHLFQVHGGGLCAYLKGDGFSSSPCNLHKSWVCMKPKSNGMRRVQKLCVSS
ncbi:C-type lectin domain family 2 member E isoform X2 [Colius striatus]|uniref:C-type lectin domain family 2 member E isoform X2 n=1 Tax=Colius striatus TaxID=57412 RepID=UPI002B1E4B62|nr:C-type lectin domain family 2 member E isoform X2 [Colius striatus]